MKKLQILLILLALTAPVHAQDDLMKMLDDSLPTTTDYTFGTFKTTRVVIGQSVENPSKGDMLFLVTHHFGALNTGYENLFGLKQAATRLGLEAGITKWLAAGFGINTYKNTWDGFLKAKVLRQSKGARVMPVSVTLFSSMAVYTTKWEQPDRDNLTSSRFSYAYEAIIARKFCERFSMQVAPVMVHLNLVPTAADNNNVFSLGVGGRIKISDRVSVNADYYYLFPDQIVSTPVYSSFSIGVDIETGGHVFQVFLTNSMGEHMEAIVSNTTGKWSNGAIFLGFNISRVFSVF